MLKWKVRKRLRVSPKKCQMKEPLGIPFPNNYVGIQYCVDLAVILIL